MCAWESVSSSGQSFKNDVKWGVLVTHFDNIMILSKPLKIRSLQLILDFVAENGPVVSRQDCQLVEHGDKMQWVPSNHMKSYRTTIDTAMT